MDIVLFIKALVMGLIEGATEFLPISSTGHLIVAGDMMQFMDKNKRDVFEIVIQLGAILSVIWLYHTRFTQIAKTFTREPESREFVLKLFLAFLPLAILGLLFHHRIEALLFSPKPVAIAMIVGGLVIFAIERLHTRFSIYHIKDVSMKHSVLIGFTQSLALFPGVSRSGATILGGICLGLDRKVATEFSFFLAVPVMLAATGYDLLKNAALFSISDIPLFITGFMAAFIAGLIAVKSLIHFVAHHNFNAFAWYRILVGLLILFIYR
jgi:undecaprenyl-diphosphatase